MDTLLEKNVALHLVIQIKFLLGWYHGSEWPPSPRRLFLAFVAALYQGREQRVRIETGERALTFFERLPPPDIYSSGYEGCEYTLFVPNNDKDVLSFAYKKGKKPSKSESTLKTSKRMNPYIADTVQYVWKINDCGQNSDEIKTLCELAKEIPVLGLGIDPVAAHGAVINQVPYFNGTKRYTKDNNGQEYIMVPKEGLLEDAKRHHKEFLERITKKGFRKPYPITMFDNPTYRKYDTTPITDVFTIKNSSNRRHSIPIAMAEEVINKVSKIISNTDELYDETVKITIMPTIGKYGDGMIRRIAVTSYLNVDNERIEALRALLNTSPIYIYGQNCQLEFTSRDNDNIQKIYSKKSKAWRSVTPLDLDLQKNVTREDMTKSVLKELRKADVNERVAFINFRKDPYWNGLTRLSGEQMLTYVEIEFAAPVKGPLVIGRNQNRGHGLLAAGKMPDVAYFTILGDRPPITKTLAVADLLRRSVMSKIKNGAGEKSIPSYISGHDSCNRSLKSNHAHTFWLPIDTDQDGLIDHVAAFVDSGFDSVTRNAFYHITHVTNKQDLRIMMHFDGFYDRDKMDNKCIHFQKHKRWISATPYFMPWHTKKTLTRDEQIRKEWKMRWHNEKIAINSHDIRVNGHIVPPATFQNTHGKLRPINRGESVMLELFEPVRGPISLGFGSHFGLGMFVPSI